MAERQIESDSDNESPRDTLASLEGIGREAKSKRLKSRCTRTYSTSEVDREEKESEKILIAFMSGSPALSPSIRDPQQTHWNFSSVTEDSFSCGEMRKYSAASCKIIESKKKSLGKAPTEFSSPPTPARPRPTSVDLTMRGRSNSLPNFMRKKRHNSESSSASVGGRSSGLTEREAQAAILVGRRLSDLAFRVEPHVVQTFCDQLMVSLVCSVQPKQIFWSIFRMVKGHRSSLSTNRIIEILQYSRKTLSHLLVNLQEDRDANGLWLINQFVDFFNVSCLPWIRSQGGWGAMLRRAISRESSSRSLDDSSGYHSRIGDESSASELDVQQSYSVFSSSDTDEDNDESGIMFLAGEPSRSQPTHQSTPIVMRHQLSVIVETEIEAVHMPPTSGKAESLEDGQPSDDGGNDKQETSNDASANTSGNGSSTTTQVLISSAMTTLKIASNAALFVQKSLQ